MKLVAITALLAVCGAAKLDRTYLPPSSAATAGGNSDSLQTPFSRSSDQGQSSDRLPTGSYTNSFQGVVVDAATAGIRASNGDQSGLGGPRDSYGSENSKVGDAAFKGSIAGFRSTPTFGSLGLNGQSEINPVQNFGTFESKSERPQAFKDRNSNIISYANDVSVDNYSYGFESDNGIAVGENGVANNGIQAQGGYSYKGDDGQVYKVTYVADEGGYRPQGAHLPTPPPIPKEILESLEQNAREEAAGLVDDGSYDAQKYNAEGDYTHHYSGNFQYNGAQLSQFAKRPESDATASNTFINQNSQAFGKPSQLGNSGAQNTHSNFNGQSNQFGSIYAGNKGSLPAVQDKQTSHSTNGNQQSTNTVHGSGQFDQSSNGQSVFQFGQTQGTFGSVNPEKLAQANLQGSVNQFGSQDNQQYPANQFGSQTSQQSPAHRFGNKVSQQGSTIQFGTQAAKPSFGQSSNYAYDSQSNQGLLSGNQAFKPQASSSSSTQVQNDFGQHSQYNNNKQDNSQVSQTDFGNVGYNPSFGSFSANKPSAVGPSQVNNNGNRFPNTPNTFGGEYLPPLDSNDRTSFNKPQPNTVPKADDTNKDLIPNVTSLGGQSQGLPQGSSASAFASVGPAGFVSQTAKPLNAFQTQPVRPNQFNYNKNNNQLISQEQTQSNAIPISSQHSGSNAALNSAGAKPTSVPETELTTPLESNEKPSFSQESQFNGQSESNFANSNSDSINNQAQPQIDFQSNIPAAATQQSKGQKPSYPDSPPQGTTQFGFYSPTLATFSDLQKPGSNQERPQNTFGQNQQYNANPNQINNAYYSTQMPSFSQGPDDSYYYNQPSKQFGTPARPQGSRFPSSPSYQPNSVISQSNQFSSQQSSLTSSTKFPSSSPVGAIAPTPTSQLIQNQGSLSTNYYNGITQASISPFPAISPTTSSQYNNQNNQFGPKPNLNQPSNPKIQSNRPIDSQQLSAVPSFPTKPSTFEQNPSSFTQTQNPFGPNSSPNNETQTQQYQGTIYEYNKPPEVLPAPEQTDSASSSSVQSDLSSKPQEGQAPNAQVAKPQSGAQQTQSGQIIISQESNMNQGFGLQHNTQHLNPFGGTPSKTIVSQFGQNTQSNLQPVQSNKPVSAFQYTQNQQISSGSRPQFSPQPTKPLGGASSPLQIGQNTQQLQGVPQTSGFTSTLQTQGLQSNVQPFKPQSDAQLNQFGQGTQATFESTTAQQSSGLQLISSPSQFGQAAQTQGSHSSGFPSSHLGSQNSQAHPLKPFGTSQSFQGYPSSKPQFGTQVTQNKFSQSFQQSFGATQIGSQPALGAPTSGQQLANVGSIYGSPDSQKPQFGQSSLGAQSSGPSFGQQPFQNVQFGSSTSKPQFGTQTQNGDYKPFGASSSQGSTFQLQNKLQNDQSSQSSQSASTTNSPPQFGIQPFKPFGSSATQGLQNKPEPSQNKPFASQPGSPCCQGSTDSSIAPLNVGKPSQAFAQTQTQFSGFQGVQSLNAQSVAGKGEEFGGPRQPPSFDAETGYHY